MLHQIFLSFFRAIFKNKVSFFIKSVGLILSLSVTILVTSYVRDEFLFDKFHAESDLIYRIVTTSNFSGEENTYSRTPLPLAEKVGELASVTSVSRIFSRAITVSIPETATKYNEPNVWFADSTITKILSLKRIHGSIETALLDVNSVIISDRLSQKYFGETNVIGKSLLLENSMLVTVAAVVEAYPEQSTFQFDMIAPFERYFEFENPDIVDYLKTDWIYTSVFSLIKVCPGNHEEKINNELRAINAGIPDERVRNNIHYTAQPLEKIHLHSQFRGEQNSPRILNLIVLIAIGVTLFAIAIVNYISLTTAEWTARTKEINIRRLLGSSASQLKLRFCIETLLFTLVLLPTVFATAYMALPHFNTITQKHLSPEVFLSWPVVAMLGLAIATYTTVSGVFLLKLAKQRREGQKVNPSTYRTGMPASLVIQGALTISISCLAVIAFRQLDYVQQKNLGFQKSNLISIPLFSENFNSIIGQVTGDLRGRMNYFENEILRNPDVEAISCSAFRLGEGTISALTKTDSLGDNDNVFLALNSVDYDFIETADIKLLAGRGFSREHGTDHLQAFIINEEAVKRLGFKTPEDAVGKYVEAVDKKGKVVGVVSDFHFEGLQNQIRPLLLEVAAWKFTTFTVRLSGHDNSQTIDFLKSKWDEVFPETVFEYDYLESRLANNYQFETSLANLATAISIMTVLLSLLGLYASASHLAVRKLKDVTVRKVLGASHWHLVHVFGKPFVVTVLLAFTLSVPVTYYCGTEWLSTFAYHTAIRWTDLGLIFVASSCLTLLSISQHLWKVVRINPVEHLRHE